MKRKVKYEQKKIKRRILRLEEYKKKKKERHQWIHTECSVRTVRIERRKGRVQSGIYPEHYAFFSRAAAIFSSFFFFAP